MPQITNLNAFPYFDDFDRDKDYYKVLFKPGYPVQARELTTLQSILQNQIESFGNHVFKEGSVVIPGRLSVNNQLSGIKLESNYFGLSVENYTSFLVGKTITGSTSGVQARIESIDTTDKTLLYITYTTPSSESLGSFFTEGETILITEDVPITETGITTISAGQGIGVVSELTLGTSVVLSEGVFFIRGYFISAAAQEHVIDPRQPAVNARVGFLIQEELVTAQQDQSLFDNSAGFENYSAPGADRFKITLKLSSLDYNDQNTENFVELMRISQGVVVAENITNPQYNVLSEEFARRTYDESGDYYVSPLTVDVRECLSNYKDNNGIYLEGQVTSSGNLADESLGVYKISAGKAYIKGFEVDVISPVNVDFIKPRTTKLFESQSITYFTGPAYTLNRVYGCPSVGFSTDYSVSLRNQRIGDDPTVASGDEIGIARVYDIALESGSYDTALPDLNQWDISLFDLQTYTKITVNESIDSLTVPTFIKGQASGATAFLRYAVTGSDELTVYNVSGKFIFGEKLLFDGERTNRVINSITEYGVKDVKSIYSNQGSVFCGDVIQFPLLDIGQVSITPVDIATGISTVTTIDYDFSNRFNVNDLVSFTVEGSTYTNLSRVTEVSEDYLKITGVTTVTGLYEGSLYLDPITPIDFTLESSRLQSSTDNTFYTPLPKKYVSGVNLENSNLNIRKVFDVNIVSGSVTIAPEDVDPNETFLPFDEERYILCRSDGTVESLTPDKFNILSGGKELVINGLGSNSSATLVATMRRINIKTKNKNRNRVKIITVDKSNNPESGIGATTKNDGLEFGNYPYGTRIQDEEICLLYPDVTKIHGVFESNSLNDPELPKIQFEFVSSINSSTFDIVVGEEIYGQTSNASAIVCSAVDSNTIEICYLNDNRFISNEVVTCLETGVYGSVSRIITGDNEITEKYDLDISQTGTSYNYSKIIRRNNFQQPSRKLKIVFEYASLSSSVDGDLITVDSYNQYDYCDIPSINGIKNSDILDIRPRVAPYVVQENARSPFEFLGKSYVSSENESLNILAPDESILIDYAIYLPRIDKLFLNRDKSIIVKYGIPAEIPEEPDSIPDSLEIAKVSLPAYLCNISDAKLSLVKHKRYRMSDISLLEERIKNLEYYTSLSLLETNTSNLPIPDANGLDRFKSGFFVDNFSSLSSQAVTNVPKNSIDTTNNELRPSAYTTEVDLVLGAGSLTGIGTEKNPGQDPRFASDLIGDGVVRSTTDRLSSATADGMGVLTLDYNERILIDQPYATRIENVTPYMVTFYGGEIVLSPSSDIWVDQVRLETNTVEGLISGVSLTQTQAQLSDLNPQLGWSPVIWNAWEQNWTGSTSRDDVQTRNTNTNVNGSNATLTTETTIRTTTRTGTATRNGTSQRVNYSQGNTYNLGDRIVSVDVAPFVRSRNVEFTARRMKPYTELRANFDKVFVSQYIVPKLLEVEVISGSFTAGETVTGGNPASLVNNSPYIQFRVADIAHKSGPYNNPTEVYTFNPFNREAIEDDYTSNTNFVNIDTASLSLQSENSFFGFTAPGTILVGKTSGCRARVVSLRLITDIAGTCSGSFFIPNPNAPSAPKFRSGTVEFALENESPFTSDIPGGLTTSAKKSYFSTGSITPVQGTVLSTRNVEIETAITGESRNITDTTTAVVNVNTSIAVEPPPPAVDPPGTPTTNDVGGGGGTIGLPPRCPSIVETTTTVRVPAAQPPAPAVTVGRGGRAVAQGRGAVAAPRPAAAQIRPVTTAARTTSVAQTRLIGGAGTRGVRVTGGARVVGSGAILARAVSTAESTTARNIGPRGRTTVTSVPVQGSARPARVVSRTTVTRQRPRVNPRNGRVICVPPPPPSPPDPIAQSFTVPGSGTFITAVDFYFAEKDVDDASVWVELRPMKLGLPESFAHPMSHKVVYARDIQTSTDATLPTRVAFDAPIYLEGGKEHCVVMGSDSNKFTVWISRLGELNINDQLPVTTQPTLGSLFKSQNATTWTPSQYEDVKYTLYSAEFIAEGNVSFFNPDLKPSLLTKDSLTLYSNRIRVGLGTTINSFDEIVPGNTVFQEGSPATGNYIGGAGIATGSLNITNSGIGYTPFTGYLTYNDVQLTTIIGDGENATANITIENGVAIAATIVSGGNGYVVGDVLTAESIGNDNLGRNLRLSVSNITGINEIILDEVQGSFEVGTGKTVKFINSSGVSTVFSQNSDVVLTTNPRVESDGLHMRVTHFNHGMHSLTNTVSIRNVESDFVPTTLQFEYNISGGDEITLVDSTGYDTFENVTVSGANPGYILIGEEIISYTAVNGNILSGITRGIDSTNPITHEADSLVYKYELNGISLRRINKDHDIQDSSIVTNEGIVGFDHYYLKIDTSSNGINRSSNSGDNPSLKFNETKAAGGSIIQASNNIQFEIMKPIIQTMQLPSTNILAACRTVTSTSVSGSEVSFLDSGFQEISLHENNYFDTPRLIASNVNATGKLTELPGNKSMEILINMSTRDANVSPVIDLDRVGAILISNRVNNIITDYTNDPRVSTLKDDPSAFVYATKPIELEIPANSLKVVVSAYVNQNSDIRSLFFTSNNQDDLNNIIYYPFPGYTNRIASGEIIDINDNDGTSDSNVPKVNNYGFGSNELVFRDYEFTIDDLSPFRYFSIKLIGTTTNQAYPPRFRDLRVVAFT